MNRLSIDFSLLRRWSLRVHRSSALVVLALFCLVLPARSQQAAIQPSEAMELAATYNEAMQAFNAGDWATAAEGLEKAIRMVQDPLERAKIGPVFFTLGASYFNLKNYSKAIETLKTYVSQYPQAERVAEARLAIARAMFLNKDYEGAVAAFAQFESVPALRDQALAAQAECYKQIGKPEEQIRVLEKLISPEIKSGTQASSAVALAELYLSGDQAEKALNLVVALHGKIGLVDNVVALNALTVKLGDELAERKYFSQALAAYRVVRTREQVITFQRERISEIERRIKATLDSARGNPQAFMAATGAAREMEAQKKDAETLLTEFEKLPDFGPAILFRMAKAWYDWEKKWEASVVFARLVKEYPESKEGEAALFAEITCFADLNRVQRTLKLCDEYLAKFPKGPNAATVGYLKGAAALQSNDAKSAVTYFGTMLDKQPDSQFREQMRFLLGNAHFVQGQFAEARENYRRYMKDFPKGNAFEEVVYRDALTLVFEGKYEEAIAAFNAYLTQYPNGEFAADTKYRLMVCKYAGSLYEEVIADAEAWHKQFPDHQMAGEVDSLRGDSLAALGKTADAVDAYTRAYKAATTDEVLNYALFEASKQLQKLGRWPEVAQMFEEFVKEQPDHPTVVAAMFWIGKVKAREGKVEEAKAFLIENLKAYINEPKREAVEQLLTQLAQLCAKRPRPPVRSLVVAPPAVNTEGATPAPAAPSATPVPLPPYDAVAELKKQLEPLVEVANKTGKARLLYAEAELLKLIKRGADAVKIHAQIAEEFETGELSPVLLALIGDHLLSKGERDKAGMYYAGLRDDYPKSDYLDYAFVGLGEVAFAAGDYKKALELFTHAADEIAGSKIKEATIGKARAQLELGQYTEAMKNFQQVAGIREWRGEATALAVYHLGEIEARQGKWAEAIAHFQRVFVAYQKYSPWAAKAYVRAAECFEKLGKRKEAIGHLQEMLRKERLKDLPETQQARQMLNSWGGAA